MRVRGIVAATLVLVLQAPAAFAQVASTHGVVTADHEIAARAGAAMLAKGGNAVDAAVATSFALSVVRPMSCGIGGGGFMLIHDPSAPEGSRDAALNYRETAPTAVGPDFFTTRNDPDASRITGAAVGVPGTVAGLWEAHRRYGSLPWADVLEPAIRAAEDGFVVNADYMASANEATAWYIEDESRTTTHAFVWKRFLREGRIALGDILANPEQGRALRLIAAEGPSAFYEGPIGRAIIATVQGHYGVLTRDDLLAYAPEDETPLRGSFLGRTILTMPPPSSGGIAMLQALGAFERYLSMHDLSAANLGHNDADAIHVITELFKHVFADRAAFLGDDAFVEVPIERLLSGEALDSIAARISADGVLKGAPYGTEARSAVVPDDAGTSHFSVIDAGGMAVACTETINLTFGSRIAVEEFGFCLNNEMDDFTTSPGAVNAFGLRQSDRNLPAPGKRPLSSMSPTIVLDVEGRVEMLTGARGGPRIITATIQTLLNDLFFELPPNEVVGAPRFHHQWFPPILAMEPALHLSADQTVDANPEDVMRLFQTVKDLETLHSTLRRKGHLIGEIATVGVTEVIIRADDGYIGAADPRGGGATARVTESGEIIVEER